MFCLSVAWYNNKPYHYIILCTSYLCDFTFTPLNENNVPSLSEYMYIRTKHICTGPTKKKWRSDREANRHGSLHAQPYSILKKMAIHLGTNRDGSRAEVPPEKKWRALSCLRDHLKTSFFACTKIVHASIIFPLKSPPQWFFRREIVLHDTPISSQYGYVFLMVF